MQQLQRRYNLPNCTLILEGLHDPNSSIESSSPMGDFQPARLNILLNAECHIAGYEQPLAGGKEFFTHLVTAVSHYAQQCLSGVPRSKPHSHDWVQLKSLETDLHELIIRPKSADAQGAAKGSIALMTEQTFTLTTVQLFDLVEAIDQFFEDPLALPELTLALAPVSRRSAPAQGSIVQRVAVPALGATGLAIAATVFFFSPVPEIKPPKELTSPTTTEQSTGNEATPTRSPLNPTDSETPVESAPSSSDPQASPPADPQAAITDLEQLSALKTKLYDKLNEAWKPPINFEQPLAYRVSVNPEGDIVGYVGENAAAGQFVEETPLDELLYHPTEGTQGTNQAVPLAQFKVIFTPSGELQINPYGDGSEQATDSSPSSAPATASAASTTSPTPSPTPSAAAGSSAPQGEAIADYSLVAKLTKQTYALIDKQWTTAPTFEQPLSYRVKVSRTGEILEFQPLSEKANQYNQEVPLSKLRQPSLDNPDFIEFRVVFTPSGVLEVSPWNGL
jgi:hypothetical protein